MSTIDPAKLAAYVKAHPSNTPYYCLAYWYQAALAAGMPHYAGSLPTALDAAHATPGIGPTPVANGFGWFGGGDAKGDIVAIINGGVYATDVARLGTVARTTIPDRLATLRAIHGPTVTFLGYSSNLLGTPVTSTTTHQEEDMPITDDDATKIALKTLNMKIGNNKYTVAQALVLAAGAPTIISSTLTPILQKAGLPAAQITAIADEVTKNLIGAVTDGQ